MDILIKSSETQEFGKQIISYVEDLNNEIKKYLTTLDTMGLNWKNHTEVTKQLSIMKDEYALELQELSEAIQKLGQYLSNVSEAYSILDEVNSSKKINV